MSLLSPLSLGAFCLAFWKRSVVWGLVILNVMAVGKLLWGAVAGDGTGWAMAAPGLAGMVIRAVGFLWVAVRDRALRPAFALHPMAPPLVSISLYFLASP